MHLLNALPQRLDPGATPTFAGLISATLTSPAATNLTLGLGTGGTALTLASSTLAATFAGSITAAGAGSFTTADATQTFRIKGATGMLRVAGYVDAANGTGMYALNAAENAYIPFFINASEIFLNIAGTPKLSIGTTGTVSIASTTAGSSGAGALVVAGGLSAAGASYFGGQVTGARPFMSTGAIQANMTSAGGFGFSGGGTNFYSFGANSATSGSFAFQSVSSDASVNFNALTLAAGTGAATFAGAVTVPSLFMSTDAQGSILSSSGNTLFIDAAAGGMTIRPKAGSVFHVSNGAPVRFSAYGAGAATFDSSGNITSVSDARMKNITGTFTKGLAEIVKLTPKLYTWKPETGLVTDDINATLIAQDLIAAGIPEAVTTYRTVAVMEDDVQSAEDIAAGKPVTQHPKLDADGKAVTQRVDSNYSVSDRTVIAALVNAVKELKAEIDALKAK